MAGVARRRFLFGSGALLAAPLARAQSSRRPARIGVLQTRLTIRDRFWTAFFDSMRERGWREGVEYVLETRESRGDPARALAMARELIRERVDLVLAITTASAVAAKQASASVPVVTWCGYAVEAGLAESLARPGGNVTGVANYAGAEVWGRFVALLCELRPGLSRLGVLWDYVPPGFPDGPIAITVIQNTALRAGTASRVWMLHSGSDLVKALSEIDLERTEALIISNGGGVNIQQDALKQIAETVTRRRLPAITDVATATLFGGTCVLAYSPNVPEILGRLAYFVDRILRGATPGALPFELPSRFELAVNAGLARRIGLDVPEAILLQATSVIE